MISSLFTRFLLSLTGLCVTVSAYAGSDDALSSDKFRMGMLPGVTPIKEKMVDFHNHILLWLVSAIVLLVLALLIYIVIRFSAKNNPEPSKVTHNVPLEVVWTLIPVLILAAIAFPSFKLLYYLDKTPKPELTVKVTGHQWYWEYQYPDSDFSFNSNLIPEADLKPEQHRLLDVDNVLVLPANTNVQFLVTAADVLHGFFIPAFGINKLAVPGRVNEIWANIDKVGTYYGQCSKICGVNHGYMPLEVKVVPKDEFFNVWLPQAKKQFADNAIKSTKLAIAQ